MKIDAAAKLPDAEKTAFFASDPRSKLTASLSKRHLLPTWLPHLILFFTKALFFTDIMK
jgi:hypothetical protein